MKNPKFDQALDKMMGDETLQKVVDVIGTILFALLRSHRKKENWKKKEIWTGYMDLSLYTLRVTSI